MNKSEKIKELQKRALKIRIRWDDHRVIAPLVMIHARIKEVAAQIKKDQD